MHGEISKKVADSSYTSDSVAKPILTAYALENLSARFIGEKLDLSQICKEFTLNKELPERNNTLLYFLSIQPCELFTHDMCDGCTFSTLITQLTNLLNPSTQPIISEIIFKCLNVTITTNISSQQLLEIYDKLQSCELLHIPNYLFNNLIAQACKNYFDLERLCAVKDSYFFNYIMSNKLTIIKNLSLSCSQSLDVRKIFGVHFDDTASDVAKAIQTATDPESHRCLARKESTHILPYME